MTLDPRNFVDVPLYDSRWGQTLDPSNIAASVGQSMSGPAPQVDACDLSHARDWTVYAQRRCSEEGNTALYELVVQWGSGGAEMQHAYPLEAVSDVVAHVVAAQPPRTWLRTTRADEGGVEAESIPIFIAPGRPSLQVVTEEQREEPEPDQEEMTFAFTIPFGAIGVRCALSYSGPYGADDVAFIPLAFQAGPRANNTDDLSLVGFHKYWNGVVMQPWLTLGVPSSQRGVRLRQWIMRVPLDFTGTPSTVFATCQWDVLR